MVAQGPAFGEFTSIRSTASSLRARSAALRDRARDAIQASTTIAERRPAVTARCVRGPRCAALLAAWREVEEAACSASLGCALAGDDAAFEQAFADVVGPVVRELPSAFTRDLVAQLRALGAALGVELPPIAAAREPARFRPSLG